MASEIKPFDALELTFHQLAKSSKEVKRFLPEHRKLVHEYEITPELLAMTHAWQIPNRDKYIIATKGAPESIIKLCQLNATNTQQIISAVNRMAKEGLRVLAVAKAESAIEKWPETPDSFRFSFLGLVGLSDPLRPSAFVARVSRSWYSNPFNNRRL